MSSVLTKKNDYWRISRTPSVGVLFVAPLWILYEVLAYHLNNGLHGQLRTGIDFLLKTAFQHMHLPLAISVILPAGLLVVYLAKSWPALKNLHLAPRHFAMMFLESLLYAVFFGLIVGNLIGFILVSAAIQWDMSAIAAIIMRIGAGVYEEICFRWLFISFIIVIMSRILKLSLSITYITAVMLSGFVFSLFHYIDYFGQPLLINTFLFRFVSGIIFAILFLVRGIGVTVYTHSLYNFLLFLRT